MNAFNWPRDTVVHALEHTVPMWSVRPPQLIGPLLTLLLCCGVSHQGHATPFWGPVIVDRETGAPRLVSTSISIDNPLNKYVLVVTDHSTGSRSVEGLTVQLNGSALPASAALGGQQRTVTIALPVVHGVNRLTTRMAGPPGTSAELLIHQLGAGDARANDQFDLWLRPERDYIDLIWDPESDASRYVVSRSLDDGASWDTLFSVVRNGAMDDLPPIGGQPSCYRVEARDERDRTIRRYEQACLTASAVTDRPEVADFASPSQPWNSMCLDVPDIEDHGQMSIDDLRLFIDLHGQSSLSVPLFTDVDGQTFDPAVLIHDVAVANSINPQILVTLLQRENSAWTIPLTPGARLKILNWGKGASTVRRQLDGTAAQLRSDLNKVHAGVPTIGNWLTGRTNFSTDGFVPVTPENDAVTALYAFNPEVGKRWGGTQGHRGNWLFCELWTQYRFGSHARLRIADVSPADGAAILADQATPIEVAITVDNGPVPPGTSLQLLVRDRVIATQPVSAPGNLRMFATFPNYWPSGPTSTTLRLVSSGSTAAEKVVTYEVNYNWTSATRWVWQVDYEWTLDFVSRVDPSHTALERHTGMGYVGHSGARARPFPEHMSRDAWVNNYNFDYDGGGHSFLDFGFRPGGLLRIELRRDVGYSPPIPSFFDLRFYYDYSFVSLSGGPYAFDGPDYTDNIGPNIETEHNDGALEFRYVAAGDYHLPKITSHRFYRLESNAARTEINMRWTLNRVALGEYPAPHEVLDEVMASQEGRTSERSLVVLAAKGVPNPFRRTTDIRYTLPAPADVSVSIFDLNGRLVTRLAEGFQPAGEHLVAWQAGAASPGLYTYRVVAGEAHVTGKLLLLK